MHPSYLVGLAIAGLFGIRNGLETAVFSTGETAIQKQTVHIFNWRNYVAPDLIKEFEAKMNYKETIKII